MYPSFLSSNGLTRFLRIMSHSGFVLWLCVADLSAATLTYDSDGNSANGITDGTASAWNTTAANTPWYDSVGNAFSAWPNTQADIAVFGGGTSGTAGTVSVGTVTTNGIIFNTPFAGSYTLSGGTINLDGSTPTITANTTAQINSKILTSSLLKNGSGLLVLSNSGNNLGNLTIDAGRLDMFSTVISANVVVNGSGNFSTHSGNTWTMDSLTYATSASSSFYAGNNHSNYTIGAGGLTLNGTGNLSINADTNASNPISKVILQGNIAVNQTSTFGVGGSAAATQKLLDLDGAVRTVTVADGKTFTLNPITQNGGFIKEGTGTMVMQGANTYAGNTVVNAGTLKMGGSGTLGAITNDLTVATGATLDLNGISQIQDVLDGAGTVTNTNSTTATLTLGSNDGSGVFDGLISSKVAIVKSGTGSQTFTSANTYSGGTTLESGTLIGIDTTVYGSTNQIKKTFGTGTLTLNGGTLQVRANGTSSTTAETLNLANTVIVGGDVTIDIGRESGVGTTKTIKFGTFTMGAHTLTTKAPNGYSVDFTSSTLTGDVVFDVQSGTLNFANTMNGGTNSITKNGAGRFTMRGGSLGNLTVNAGIADIYGTTTMQDVLVASGNLETHSGTTFSMNSLTYQSNSSSGFSAFSANSTYTIGAGGLSISTNATLSVIAQNAGVTSKLVLQGDVTVTGNSSLIKSNNVSYLGTMLVDLDGSARSFDVAATKTFTLGVITQNGGITKMGAGTMLLTEANTYAGNTLINEGILKLSATGAIDGSARISVASGATFDVSTITGYSVKNTQKLEGGGTVTGSVTVDSGALLAPGITGLDEVQKLTISGALTLSSGSQTVLDLSNLDGYDQIDIGGAFTQATGAQIVVTPGDFVPAQGQSFQLFDWGSLVSLSTNLGPAYRDGSEDDLSDLNLPDISGSGWIWDVSQFATTGIVSVVPEPSRFLLLLLGGLTLIGRRRRK